MLSRTLFKVINVTPSWFNTSMNKQLQLIENEELIAANKEKPWKLSQKDRYQGLAGIAKIKQILASKPLFAQDNEQFARAS